MLFERVARDLLQQLDGVEGPVIHALLDDDVTRTRIALEPLLELGQRLRRLIDAGGARGGRVSDGDFVRSAGRAERALHVHHRHAHVDLELVVVIQVRFVGGRWRGRIGGCEMMDRLSERLEVVGPVRCVSDQRFREDHVDLGRQPRDDLGGTAHRRADALAAHQLVKDGTDPEDARTGVARAARAFFGRKARLVACEHRGEAGHALRELPIPRAVQLDRRRVKEEHFSARVPLGELDGEWDDYPHCLAERMDGSLAPVLL